MSIDRLLKAQKQENQEIVTAILDDGSNTSAEYTIEHHFASDNFDRLEKAAVDAFKAGFEVSDAEEVELEDGSVILCFDAIAHSSQYRLGSNMMRMMMIVIIVMIVIFVVRVVAVAVAVV